MGSDILERIEAWDRCYPGNLNIEMLVEDAADEIARLRTALATAEAENASLRYQLVSDTEINALERRLAAAEAERDAAARDWNAALEAHDRRMAEVVALTAERDAAVERAERARAEALEEAAAMIEADGFDADVRKRLGEDVKTWIRRQQAFAIRALRAGAAALRPMTEAQNEPVLVRFRDDLTWRDERWSGRWCVMRREGVTESGYDLGWSVAAPVGYGGIPTEWLAGWLPLPALRAGDQADTLDDRLSEARQAIADQPPGIRDALSAHFRAGDQDGGGEHG